MSWGDWGTSEDLAYEEEVAYAEEREREAEAEWEAREAAKRDAFDAALDAYQEREREHAAKRADLGNEQAVRPDAERETVTFGDLVVGDFMTAEEGPSGRWVKVVKVERDQRKYSTEAAPGWVAVTFQTPQPLGVGYVDRWVIERQASDPVVIDRTVRDA